MVENIILEVIQEEDGGFCAECLSEDIFTQANTWDELKINVIKAVKAFYFERSFFPPLKLHLVKDETLVISSKYIET